MTHGTIVCGAWGAMILAGIAACGAESPSAPISPPSTSTHPPSSPPAISTTPPTTPVPPATSTSGACVVHQDAFRVALASATGTCATNDDCGCYTPVIAEAGCGGITDAATATRLRAIEDAWRSDGCQWPHQCGPWRCEPVCREGRCVNAGQIDPSTL
ncbi:MAG: hypothetical protein J0L92_12755 [Deltaproteobacteria bacterium]|nr:hypothetical protein [Deltaproteobacteria bacterium]